MPKTNPFEKAPTPKQAPKMFNTTETIDYLQKKGLFCHVITDNTGFGVIIQASSVEDLKLGVETYLEQVEHFSGTGDMVTKLTNAKNIIDANYPCESIMVGNREYLLSVPNQEVRTPDGTVIHESKLEAVLTKKDLLQYFGLVENTEKKPEVEKPKNQNTEDDDVIVIIVD